MKETTEDRKPYLTAFARLEKRLPSNGRSWVVPLRKEAIARFADLGFPTVKDEAWRSTSLARLTKVPFTPAEGGRVEGLTPELLERLTFEPWDCSHLVFVNGRYAPDLSRLRAQPVGVRVMSLAEALASERSLLEPHLGRLARAADRTQVFAALNTAFLEDGAFLHVPAGVVIEEPIHLLFVSTANGRPAMSHPRVLVVAGEASRATLVESFVGIRNDVYFTNAVTEIVAGPAAVIDHYRLQRESEEAFHITTLAAEVGRGASYACHAVALGGGLVRNDVSVVLGGEGGDCTLNGLYVTAGRQHVDNHTLIDHASPRCTSRELYKGVLDDASRGVFDGMIIVRPDAVRSDARQENRNLLLSEEALVDTKPTLQILNDDVKCSHAATIGQLDEDALFYLRSRGLGEEAARSLLIHAFTGDLVGRIKVSPVRIGLDCLLMTRLPRHHGARVR